MGQEGCRSLYNHFNKSESSLPVASSIRRKTAEAMIAPLSRARSRIHFVKEWGRSEAPGTGLLCKNEPCILQLQILGYQDPAVEADYQGMFLRFWLQIFRH